MHMFSVDQGRVFQKCRQGSLFTNSTLQLLLSGPQYCYVSYAAARCRRCSRIVNVQQHKSLYEHNQFCTLLPGDLLQSYRAKQDMAAFQTHNRVHSSADCVLFLQVTPVSFAHSHEEYLVAIGLQPTKPLSDLKAEMQEGPSDQLQHHAEAAAAAAPMTHIAGEVPGHAASSLGQFDQGQYEQGQYGSASQNQLQGQSQAQRWLTLQHTPHEPTSGIKPEPVAEPMGDVSTSSKQKVHQQSQGHPRLPLGSPGKIVPLASLHHHPAPSHQALDPRAAPIGMPSMPVGSTTGILGRSWPGQPQYGNGQPVSRPGTSAGSGPGEGRGYKRAGGGGESKIKKRQRHGDRERSVEGDQSSGKECPDSLSWLTALAHCPGSLPWLTALAHCMNLLQSPCSAPCI